MNKPTLLILLIAFNANFLFSQNEIVKEKYEIAYDSIKHERIYRIGFSSIHTVELIESKNGEYIGHLINVLTRYKRKKTKDYVQRIRIPESTVLQLMKDLQKLEIETLEECKNVLSTDYDCVSTLDGDETRFEVFTQNIIREYSFEGLYPGAKESDSFPKKQRIGQRMLNLINTKFDLKKTLHQYMKHLPSGTYGYYGVNMIKLRS